MRGVCSFCCFSTCSFYLLYWYTLVSRSISAILISHFRSHCWSIIFVIARNFINTYHNTSATKTVYDSRWCYFSTKCTHFPTHFTLKWSISTSTHIHTHKRSHFMNIVAEKEKQRRNALHYAVAVTVNTCGWTRRKTNMGLAMYAYGQQNKSFPFSASICVIRSTIRDGLHLT